MNHEKEFTVPRFWENGSEIIWRERCEIALLREAGCGCELPLLGGRLTTDGMSYYQDSVRCRTCNVSAGLREPVQRPHSDAGRVYTIDDSGQVVRV